MRRPPRIAVLVAAALAIVVVALAVSSICQIPPRSITLTAMGETAVRIGLHVQRNGRLPAHLSQLAEREGYLNRTTDAWNWPLRCTVDVNGRYMTPGKSVVRFPSPENVVSRSPAAKSSRGSRGCIPARCERERLKEVFRFIVIPLCAGAALPPAR
jgi:hypothetical protein